VNAAFGMELRRLRALVGWLAIVAIAYGGIVAGFYPTFRDNQRMIEQYMGLFPKELLSVFGMEGSLADPGAFFHMYIGGMLWPIVAAVAGIALATRPVAADLERGSLELALSTRLSRVRYLGAAIAGQVVAMAVLALATVGGILVVGWAVGAPFDLARFLLAAILAFGFGITIAAVTTLLSVVTLDRGRAAGIATGLLLGAYLLDAASKVWTGIGGVAALGPFAHFQTRPIVDSGTFPIGDLALFLVVAAAAWCAALLLFRRRDLAA
jgi:ABC-type transport system involved in multi-copper enzyme maturation permease subunit